MVVERWFFNKDALVIKVPKKSHIALRMFVLAVVMICGIYICTVCLKQIGIQNRHRLLKIEIMQAPCKSPAIPHYEFPFVHYPQPTTYSRDECACTPVRFFSIVSMQRSGSGWFETFLNSHVNISSNGEIFSSSERRSNISLIIRALDKVYNLDWYSSASKNECTAAVGLKWMLNQPSEVEHELVGCCRLVMVELSKKANFGSLLQERLLGTKGLMANRETVVEYFSRRRVSVIFLFRRNLLRRLVSQLANDHDRNTKQLNGTHKAHVHSQKEANILARYKPRMNTSELITNLKYADKTIADALEYFKNIRHTVLYYEDLVWNRTKLKDVLEFLGVPQRKLVSRHVKIHTSPLPEQVENWDDVYSSLKGTEYESFLDSDYSL